MVAKNLILTIQMKRSEIKRRPLADTVLSSLEPEEKEYRENYGVDRIYFVVSPTGRKRWELRYKKPSGTWGWLGLGSYPEVMAKHAREKAGEVVKLLIQGADPIKEKKADENSFINIYEAWYKKKVVENRSSETLSNISEAFNNYVLPVIGEKRIDKITRKDCADIQYKIESRPAYETARKVRGWLKQIFGMAIALGKTENNPASNLEDIAIKKPKSISHPHLLEEELPEFLRAFRKVKGERLTLLAARLALLTATRPGVIRYAEWSELDFEKGTWVVPASRMKMKNDHLIPLTKQMIELLWEVKQLTWYSKYVFASDRAQKNPVISSGTINKVYARAGYKTKLVGHGTRHTFKTLISEHGWDSKWSEAQLAHSKEGMEEVYNKAVYLKNRLAMMQWYNDYLDALETGMTDIIKEQFNNRVNVV